MRASEHDAHSGVSLLVLHWLHLCFEHAVGFKGSK